MLKNDTIMFDRYSRLHKFNKTLQKERKYWRTIFYNLITFSYANTLSKICMNRAEVNYPKSLNNIHLTFKLGCNVGELFLLRRSVLSLMCQVQLL